ncbi:MAG TPA: ABC transporter permease [Bryobacteraceae bacterium]|nr:ABC transporter permease [Bryobacteraceae bacterium]
MRDLLSDLHYAARVLRQNPVFAAIAMVTLALGIGGTTVIFSVLDAVLLRPLEYRDPDRLVSVATYFPSVKLETLISADYAEFERESHVFESIAAYPHGLSKVNLIAGGEPLRAAVAKVTPSFFSTLGIQPVLGRAFLPRESRPAASVAILTHGLWMRVFGGDTGVLGRSMTLDGEPYTVVGVMPASFRFPEEEKMDILTPLPLDEARMQHGPEMRTWRAIARLKPGVSLVEARAEVETIFARIRAKYQWLYRNDVRLRIVPLRAHQVRDVRLSLLVLAGAVGFVLLIACMNVAHLTLARAAGRTREIAVRAALGAGRLRLARQLLTESALLGLAGGGLGALVAFAGLRAAIHVLPADIPHIDQIAIDLRALAFAAIVAIGSGLLFGLAPVWAAARANLIEGLKQGRGAPGASRWHMRNALLAAEVAFSLVLLAGASLLFESLWRLENTPLGFHPETVLDASLPLEGTPYATGSRQKEFLHDALEHAARIPGVISAAVADTLPPASICCIQTFSRADRPLPEPGHRGDNMLLRSVSPAFFRTLGIGLVRGRLFTERDRPGAPLVAIVNQALVRRYFPNEEPLGKRIGAMRPDLVWKTIVGVVADVKNSGLKSEPQPEAYLPINFADTVGEPELIARVAGDPHTTLGVLKSELQSLDKSIPLTVRTMPQEITGLSAATRFQTILMAVFALVAVALAAVGVYGVASGAAAQRTREIGIRMALGANAGGIVRLMIAGSCGPLAVGLIAGIAGALAVARYLETLLFEVKASDPLILAAVACVLSAVALIASYIPARRASKVDPMSVLRAE